MAIFPKIDRPCPFKGDLKTIMDGDICRLCKRQVFDLTDMTDEGRVAFMKSCTGEVCVSYRAAFRPALAAAALAVVAMGAPSAAFACDDATSEVVITGGGIHDPANAEYISDKSDATDIAPALPVIYERNSAGSTKGDLTARAQPATSPAVSSPLPSLPDAKARPAD